MLDKYTLIEEVNNRNARKADMSIVVNDLINQRILGVVQDNAEHGPRALGNRSIICSPISPDMKDILNLMFSVKRNSQCLLKYKMKKKEARFAK